MMQSVAIQDGAFEEAHGDEMEMERGNQVDAEVPDPPGGPAPLQGQQEVYVPTEEPSYVYTPEGIFFVPHWYIERDKNIPVMVKAGMWQELEAHHNRFAAVNFLQATTVRAENIVVMTLTDPENPHGRYKRCHWFVRIAVQGGSAMFRQPLGSNFLWQLPYGTCTKIVQEIKAYETTNSLPAFQSSPLIGRLRPTSQDLYYKEWRDLQPMQEIGSYYDKLFAMAVKPVCRTVALPKDNPKPELDRIGRPRAIQTLRKSRLNFAKFPDDLGNHIFGIAATQWLSSHKQCDWLALLKLRAVCKTTKAIVEEGAGNLLKNMLDGVKIALKSGKVKEIMDARDSILNRGLTTISFILDTNNPQFMNLARLRSKRRPGELPPPKPPPTGMQIMLKRVFDAGQNDDDESIDPPEKSKQRVQFEKDNAFIRRQLKRRRILMERNRMYPL